MPAIVGFPYDGSSSFQRGAAEAPPLIRQALHSDATNPWTEQLVDLGVPGVLEDDGDLAFEESAAVQGQITAAVARLLGRGRHPISLGGDHSITYPILRAFRTRYPRLALLHFDAHPDLYDELQGDRFSHACPMARIMEEGLVDRLVQVGIRTMNRHQRDQAERFGVEVITMGQWRDGQPLIFESPVYVSLDIDVLDPAFAPGISHREPGGCSVRQLLAAIQSIEGNIVGADIVEFNPRNDPAGITAPVCAKLLKEIAAHIILAPDKPRRTQKSPDGSY
jgi:arginase